MHPYSVYKISYQIWSSYAPVGLHAPIDIHYHDHDEWTESTDILFCVNCQMLYWPLYDIYFPVMYGNKLFEIELNWIEIELL